MDVWRQMAHDAGYRDKEMNDVAARIEYEEQMWFMRRAWEDEMEQIQQEEYEEWVQQQEEGKRDQMNHQADEDTDLA